MTPSFSPPLALMTRSFTQDALVATGADDVLPSLIIDTTRLHRFALLEIIRNGSSVQ